MKLILLLFLILLTSCGNVKNRPKAVKGVLDLGGWDFKVDGPVKLSGEWKFHWQELKELNLKIAQSEGDFVQVPGSWTKKERPQIKRFGYGTYILQVKGVRSKDALAFKAPLFFSGYKMFVLPSNMEGKALKVFEMGRVGKTKEESTPELKVNVETIKATGKFFIFFHVSNFHYRHGSFVDPPTLGLEKEMKRDFTFLQWWDFFVAGILFIISCYHLVLYSIRKEDKASLYFGLFSLIVLMRSLSIGTWGSWIVEKPSVFSFYLFTYLEYLSLALGVPLFLSYINHLFKDQFSILKKASLWFFIPFWILFTLTTPSFYTQKIFLNLVLLGLFVFSLWLLVEMVRQYLKNTPYAKELIMSLIVLIFGALYDSLITQNLLPPPFISPFTFIGFIFFQSYILALKSAYSYKESEQLGDLLEDARIGLERTVDKKTRELKASLHETKGMLSSINKGIFSVDKRGIVLDPVSLYSKILFKKDIVGENGLNLLYFHFKEGSKSKNQLLQSFKEIFGKSESTFLNLRNGFPSRVIQPDKDRLKGRILDITTIPLLNADSKVEKIMFIVEDVTESTEEYNQYKEMGREYKVLIEVLPLERKDKIVSGLSSFMNNTVSSLGKLMEPGAEDLSKKDINTIIFNLIKKFKSTDASRLKELEKALTKIQEETTIPKDNEMGKILVWAVEKLSEIFLVLTRYIESFNFIHKNGMGPSVIYSFPKGFDRKLVEKRKDLDTLMSNLLEYVFLVRDIKDLNEENISNAPKKARLYNEFDETISKIMFRSRLIAFLLKVAGKNEDFKNYMNLSELLEQMPSKEKLNEAALVNHLMVPYKKIRG